jgi:hypothetical protein
VLSNHLKFNGKDIVVQGLLAIWKMSSEVKNAFDLCSPLEAGYTDQFTISNAQNVIV